MASSVGQTLASIVVLHPASGIQYQTHRGAFSVAYGMAPKMSLPIRVTIYHNPACGTSRNVLALIRNAGVEPEVIEYLQTPLDLARLEELIAKMAVRPREILREKGTPYAQLGLGSDHWTDDQLIGHMLVHPILINRPIVSTPWGTKLCRPPEALLEILPMAHQGPLTEDVGASRR